MTRLTVIGDIHGDYLLHGKLMRKYEKTLQLGDCGFNYKYLDGYDPEKHKVLGGNHDNYPELVKLPHYLGDFGSWNDVFYVRGAWSIDRHLRVEGRDIFKDLEQLSPEQGEATLVAYKAAKPDVVVTHDGPPRAIEAELMENSMFPNEPLHPTLTGQLLGVMLEVHQPKAWLFGHWHQSKEFRIPDCGTLFKVLDCGEVTTIEVTQ
jgi:predicted phosphodiesterase